MQTLYAIVQLRSIMQHENDNLHYNHDLEAKLVQAMNTKVVQNDIYKHVKGTPRVPQIVYTLATCKP